jgi:hypothetical protein
MLLLRQSYHKLNSQPAPSPRACVQVDIPFVFDEDHQNENFLHMSPFCSSVDIHSGSITPATMAYQHYITKSKTSLDWSSLELTLQVELFDQSDKDGDGKLTKKEINSLIETLNITITPAKIDLLFDEADDNKDGTIDRKELPALVAAAIQFERDKERDSLHRAQQVVLGENQLIDRFGRASSRALIEIVAEQAQLQCIITQRETVTAKSMAFAFSVGYILLKYALDVLGEDELSGSDSY